MITKRLPLLKMAFLMLGVLLACCRKNEEVQQGTGEVILKFTHMVDGQDLILTDQEFTNTAGNKYRVEKLKYYISNITLNRLDGSFSVFPDGYFLVEQTGLSNRNEIVLKEIAEGNYTSLSFAIGVDSARNFSTQMVGDLNPNNDMAWNWVSGYKFFLLEGKFTAANKATDALIYHIGGNRSYRVITIHFQQPMLAVNNNRAASIYLAADVNQVFNAQSIIDLNQINAVMQPGAQADRIANNYANGMFKLSRISTQ